MKTLEGGCSVPVAVNSKVPNFPFYLCSFLHFSENWQIVHWWWPLLGFGQWLGATWGCLEPRWEHVHHGHWEGISHNCIDYGQKNSAILTWTTSNRSLSLMMMTWFRPLPNDHVRPALWVSYVILRTILESPIQTSELKKHALPVCVHVTNKLAKARKMRKQPGTVGLKKFWPGKRFGSKMFGPKILAYLHTFILISGNPTKTQNIFRTFLTQLDDF